MGPMGHKSHRSHPRLRAAGGFTRGRQRVEHEHEDEHEDEDEDEDEALDQADEVEKETGPEIEHAAPGVANFAVAGGSQETGPDIVIDLLL
jgi:hypothetical protein